MNTTINEIVLDAAYTNRTDEAAPVALLMECEDLAAAYSMICTGAPMDEAALKGLHEIIGDIALEAMNDRRKKEIEHQKADQEMQEMLQRIRFGGLL